MTPVRTVSSFQSGVARWFWKLAIESWKLECPGSPIYKMAIKRFGPRYGKRVRDRLKSIESVSKKMHLCPHCRKPKAKRLSLGIFQCTKCNAKFAGKAYRLEKPKKIESAKELVPEVAKNG